MKIPISWLKEFVHVPWPPKELARRLTLAGIESSPAGEDRMDVTPTPNRGDCLSVLGMAREIAALQGKALPAKKITPPRGDDPIKNFLVVRLEDAQGAPRYMARVIRGVVIKPSPEWMQKRLESAGLRPVNNVVDCTNYVLLERGHPLHAFDLRFLRGGRVVVRKAGQKIPFQTLDAMTRACEPADLFICDAQGPVALAGIMGGKNSEVRPDTTGIVLEAAYFDPERIHATAKRLALSTESSYRFERGVDPNGVEAALHRVCQLIVQTAGGVPSRDWIDSYPKKIRPKRLTVAPSEVQRILGLKIPSARLKKTLASLGLDKAIPTWRFDINRPVDLIEEAARLFGFEKIAGTLPRVAVGRQKRPASDCLYKTAADVLNGLGFHETCHLPFVPEEKGEVRLANPLASDQAALRGSLIPGLMKAALFNSNRQVTDLKLFEWGKVFRWESDKVAADWHLGLLGMGNEWPRQWQIPPKPFDFFSLKGAMERLFQAWGLEPFELVPKGEVFAGIRWKGEVLGEIRFLIDEVSVYVCEINIQKIIEKNEFKKEFFEPISPFPFVERDLALVVASDLPADQIVSAIRQSAPSILQKIDIFDCYQGKGIEPGKKSVALALRYASRERTLTGEEVSQAHEALTERLEKTLPARLR